MSIAGIRSGIKTVLDATPGINEALAYPPDSVSAVPAAWIGDARATIQMGALEVWTWTLPVTVVVARKSVYAMEQTATDALIDDLMTEIRGSFTLNGTVYGLNVTELRQGTVSVGGTECVGFTLTMVVKEKAATTLEG